MVELPSDSEIISFIRVLLQDDIKKNNGKETTHTIRSIRIALADHFDVDADDLKERKKVVIRNTVEEVLQDLLPEDQEEEGEMGGSGEQESKQGGNDDALEEPASPAIASDLSSLDESDVGEGPSSGKKRTATKSGQRHNSSSNDSSRTKMKRSKKERSGSTDKTEEEIARLKKLVVACGVRKQWSSWFAKESADTPRDQVKALRSLLNQLGMDGRLSMEKAKKIKAEREFAEELRAIGVDAESNSDKNGRASRSAGQKDLKRDNTSDDESEDGSEEEEGPVPKKSRLGASLAAFAAELNSDDD